MSDVRTVRSAAAAWITPVPAATGDSVEKIEFISDIEGESDF